ncbi:MAG: hypothetical protein GX591_06930 [Planctomycetes bacterium]|nr:hypothetical protein [Planctomycetota bacterium]
MKHNELSSIRDTIQSIWVAIILAFVLRAFMVEAFEIPTGSMAPQLMGRHTLVTCPDCGYAFPRGLDSERKDRGPDPYAACPNCGVWINRESHPARGGDRVLVFKLPRAMRDVQRWDVVVFKDVQENRENFIKRLVGLPGEVLRIVHGDVFVHRIADRNGDGIRDRADLDAAPIDLTDWKIARKPADTQAAMWQLLFDNDYQPANNSRVRQEPWEPLWARADGAADGWDLTVNHGRVFRYDGDAPRELHFARGQERIFEATNSYNTPERGSFVVNADICSDLRLETMIVPTETGALRLTTSHFDHQFAAEFSFDGRVRLLHRTMDGQGRPFQSWEEAEVWGQTVVDGAFREGEPVTVALTHADWRATVWVNAAPVLVSRDDQYSPDIEDIAMMAAAEQAQAVPVPQVGITGLHGRFDLWHTRVFRDVFYTSPDLLLPRGAENADDPTLKYFLQNEQKQLAAQFSGRWPGWGTYANPITLRRFEQRPDYDEFFMLGDNSPQSADSRRWVQAAPTLRLYDVYDEPLYEYGRPLYRMGTVPRYQLIGKAFFVYWPAGSRVPLPGLNRLPIVPHVGKMRRIE